MRVCSYGSLLNIRHWLKIKLIFQPPLDATKVSVGEGVAKEGVVVGCGEYYKYGVKSNCSVSSIVGTGLKVDIYWGDRDRRQFDYSRIEGKCL